MPKESLSTTKGSTLTPPEADSVRLYEPRMVRLIGAHGAMVFQQMRYWLELDGGKEHDGYHWIYKSGPELADDIGLSKDQTKRTLAKLCSIGLLVAIENPISGWDRILWYRINHDHEFMQETASSHAAGESVSCNGQIRTMQSANLHHAKGTSAPSKERIRTMDGAKAHRRRGKSAPAIPETTSIDPLQENTSHTPTKRTPDSARDSVSGRGQVRRGVPELANDPVKQTEPSTAKETPQQRMAKLRAAKHHPSEPTEQPAEPEQPLSQLEQLQQNARERAAA